MNRNPEKVKQSGATPPAGDEALPLAIMLERVDFGVVLTDAEGRVRWCNPLVVEYYLRRETAAHWSGQPVEKIFAPLFTESDWHRVDGGLRRLRQSAKGRLELDGLALTWGGHSRRVIDLVLADLGVNASAPRPGWIAWFLYDVTRLRHADENLQALLRHSTDGIFMLDGDCRIRVFNQACERITGWPADDVLHQDTACRQVFGCHDERCACTDPGVGESAAAPECMREFCFQRSDQGPLTHERPIRTRSGAERWVEISYAPVANDQGQVVYVLGILRDMTRRRQLEEQLNLTRKLATLGELTSAMAHEIKNPLGIILSSAEIVANPNRPDEQKRQAAEFIRDEAKRLDERMQVFLKFTRPRPPEFVVQSIHRVLTQTIIAYQTLARDGLTLETQFGKQLPHVRIDADQMQQVFLNLLMNADQSMPGDGRVTILTRGAGGDAIEIEIADEGLGLPIEAVQRLFEPFFSTKTKGTGLGLSIVMQIVVAHGGSVTAANRPEGGSRFTVRLPAAGRKADANEASYSEPRPGEAEGAS
jgi:signal transduction histidine kinase